MESRDMKRGYLFLMSLPLVGCGILDTDDDAPRYTETSVGRAQSTKVPFCHEASEVMGSDVRNESGEDLGEVEDLVIDASSGSIEYAVLSFGGVLGIGDKLFAIPFSHFEAPEVPESSQQAYFTLDVPKAKLENAPGFPKDNWPDLSHTWCSGVDQYYGKTSKAVEDSERFRLNKASDLLGQNIENTNDENLGEIDELVLDADRDRINYFVLESGGVLGMGDKHFAIPWEALKITVDEDQDQQFVLNVTEDRLKNAPVYNENEWPRMSDPMWVRDVYEFYGVRPYWRASPPHTGSPRPEM
jgi:sporulation protein YlmC with PRC-barrel domain